jgi:hypothetical protein
MIKKFYHTQESRKDILTKPVKCIREDAWLGEAYYFWYDIVDAENWGHHSKKRTNYFEIYESNINCEDILDTVFNEKHYLFWLKQIEKVAKTIITRTNIKPTLKELNDYFKERGTWDEVAGIQFQDLPTNVEQLLVKPIEYKSKSVIFAYRKRIQLSVYKLEIITTFALIKKGRC